MYNIFGQKGTDYSNLVIEKVNFNLINASTGKVHCCYFDEGDLNRSLESNKKIMKGNTGKINIGPEGELYKYINHHAGTPTRARSKK